MRQLPSPVLRVALVAERRPRVVGLVPVWLFLFCVDAAGLWQRPSREVVLFRRVRARLGHVTARADAVRRRRLVLESLAASETKRKLLGRVVDGLLFRVVLRTWVLLEIRTLEARLCADLWRLAACLA